jgi:phosphoribosyl 1,2-cyclic phosphate phosphodiesterase
MTVQMGEVIVLGCGCSKGTPQIGNYWGKCDPTEPKNNRTRPSIAIKKDDTTIVIDTGPDFRTQINRENITKIDAVVYTHTHSDHVACIDELRALYDRTKERMPLYADAASLQDLKSRFSFVFEQSSILYAPVVEPYEITPQTPMNIHGVEMIPFTQDHGLSTSLGFRIGDFGYSTDMINLDDTAINTLKGIKTWVVDCANLYDERIFVHANLKRVLELQEKINAKQLYLTHMKANLDYQTLCRELPAHIRPGFDGLRISVTWD